jgi:hypothetical protein
MNCTCGAGFEIWQLTIDNDGELIIKYRCQNCKQETVDIQKVGGDSFSAYIPKKTLKPEEPKAEKDED